MLKGTANGGNLFIYVPAWETDVNEFKRWSMDLTENQPMYSLRTDFNNVERGATSVSKEEAMQMADFVIVTMEAERPGVLQYLDYGLQVHDARLVYVPMVRAPSGLAPGSSEHTKVEYPFTDIIRTWPSFASARGLSPLS